MHNIILSKQQAKTLAQSFYGDIHQYCSDRFPRYYLWFVNRGRKKMGLEPLEKIIFDPSKTFEQCLFSTNNEPTILCDFDEQANEIVIWIEKKEGGN